MVPCFLFLTGRPDLDTRGLSHALWAQSNPALLSCFRAAPCGSTVQPRAAALQLRQLPVPRPLRSGPGVAALLRAALVALPLEVAQLFQGSQSRAARLPCRPPRWDQYRATKASIQEHEGSLADFARGYQRYGIVREEVSQRRVPLPPPCRPACLLSAAGRAQG